MRIPRKVLAVLVTVCLLFGISLPVYAAGTVNAVNEARNGVLQVNLTYVTDQGEEIMLQSGTGFLINDEMLITSYHVIMMQEETRESLREIEGLEDIADVAINDPHLHIKVIVQRDMSVEATLHSSAYSAEVDFAVIRMTEKIYDRAPLALGDSDQIKASEEIYALGMPASSINTTESHTSEDVVITGGVASKLTEMNGIKVVEHDVKISEGSSGGPLIDVNGAVLGVNSYESADFYYSIQINHIKKALDTFGIVYYPYDGGEPTAEPTEAPTAEPTEAPTAEPTEAPIEEDNSELIENLNRAIDDAEASIKDASKYTEESVTLVRDAIADAERAASDDSATPAELQNSIDALNRAVDGLEEKSGPDFLMIGMIAAAVVLVVIIIVVIVVLSKGKKKSEYSPVSDPHGASSQGYNNYNNGGAADYSRTAGSGYSSPSSSVPGGYTSDGGTTETSVLNEGSSETTLLGGGVTSAYLIRKKTGQKIPILGGSFVIGKEKSKVNYCIPDNSAISRVHAKIERKGSDYVIIDQNSTNCTFVDDSKANPYKERALTEGAIIKLANEEFEFHQ